MRAVSQIGKNGDRNVNESRQMPMTRDSTTPLTEESAARQFCVVVLRPAMLVVLC
jgi:hypothetical protein